MSVQVNDYYQHNGVLYRTRSDQKEQTEVHQLLDIVTPILEKHITFNNLSKTHSFYTRDPLNDHWFWLNMHLAAPRFYFFPGRPAGDDGCSSWGRGCSNEGGGVRCALALLVLAIIALVGSVGLAAGVTVMQGIDADKSRDDIDKIQEARNAALLPKVREAYDKVFVITKQEYFDRSLQTFFTAIITVGLGLLTVSASLAIYCTVSKVAMFASTELFAIAGGCLAGSGILAHIFRHLAQLMQNEENLRQRQELLRSMQDLNGYLVHPNEVLVQTNIRRSYVEFGNDIFKKEDGQYARGVKTEGTLQYLRTNNFTKCELQTRS